MHFRRERERIRIVCALVTREAQKVVKTLEVCPERL